jgi:hypothetical protein
MVTCGDLSDFLFKTFDDQELLTKDMLTFTKIKFTKADLQDIYDIQENKYEVKENHVNLSQAIRPWSSTLMITMSISTTRRS